MDIVLLSQVFYPDNQSTSQLLTSLLFQLQGGRYSFTVITGYTARKKGVVPPSSETFRNIRIRRHGITADYKKSLWRRAVHYACFMLGATWDLWRLRRSDFIIAVTNPPFTPVWLWFLQRLFLGRYQLVLHDIYPDGLVAVGRLQAGRLTDRLWRTANHRAFQAADKIVVLGRDMTELLKSEYDVSPEKIEYIPHWSTFQAHEPLEVDKSEIVRQLQLRGKFIVQYSGNMGLWHDMECIVQAAHQLRKQEQIHFILIGDGVRKLKAQQSAERLHLQNMTWLPFQPQEHLHHSLAGCHLALISQRAGLQGVAVPCKLYGILASGRGILAMVPKGSEIDLVVREEQCGITIAPGDSPGLAAAILELSQDPAKVAEWGRNAFKAYRHKYTLDMAAQAYQRLWNGDSGGVTCNPQ